MSHPTLTRGTRATDYLRPILALRLPSVLPRLDVYLDVTDATLEEIMDVVAYTHALGKSVRVVLLCLEHDNADTVLDPDDEFSHVVLGFPDTWVE